MVKVNEILYKYNMLPHQIPQQALHKNMKEKQLTSVKYNVS